MTSEDSLLHSAGLAHQQSFTEVAAGLLRDLLGQLRRELQTLLLADSRQHTAHLANIGKWVQYCSSVDYHRTGKHSCPACLLCAGQGNPDGQATAPNRSDDLGGGGGAQDEATRAHVLLHGAAQCVLGVLCESVHFC